MLPGDGSGHPVPSGPSTFGHGPTSPPGGVASGCFGVPAAGPKDDENKNISHRAHEKMKTTFPVHNALGDFLSCQTGVTRVHQPAPLAREEADSKTRSTHRAEHAHTNGGGCLPARNASGCGVTSPAGVVCVGSPAEVDWPPGLVHGCGKGDRRHPLLALGQVAM